MGSASEKKLVLIVTRTANDKIHDPVYALNFMKLVCLYRSLLSAYGNFINNHNTCHFCYYNNSTWWYILLSAVAPYRALKLSKVTKVRRCNSPNSRTSANSIASNLIRKAINYPYVIYNKWCPGFNQLNASLSSILSTVESLQLVTVNRLYILTDCVWLTGYVG